ncbi:MAG: hypothetical protein J6D47_19965 [Peptostreptococcaceae bacterium]|nr:hypothetical protein [Peptostreptococcaceae bacterium]
MLIKKYKVESYTFHEFFNKEELTKLDKAIEHINKNKKKYMLLVTIIAITIDLSNISSFALTPGVAAIDIAGKKILDLIRRVGYWIAIILCSKDVLKHCMRGHMESIGSVIAMYGLSFGVLYFLPWLFDLIKSIF